jgi:hypothetical protein
MGDKTWSDQQFWMGGRDKKGAGDGGGEKDAGTLEMVDMLARLQSK